MTIKKLFGDRNFYRTIFSIAVPIMIQNGITNFVALLDNIMIGQVGTEQMSGTAIVNQLMFVVNLCVSESLQVREFSVHSSSARAVPRA